MKTFCFVALSIAATLSSLAEPVQALSLRTKSLEEYFNTGGKMSKFTGKVTGVTGDQGSCKYFVQRAGIENTGLCFDSFSREVEKTEDFMKGWTE